MFRFAGHHLLTPSLFAGDGPEERQEDRTRLGGAEGPADV